MHAEVVGREHGFVLDLAPAPTLDPRVETAALAVHLETLAHEVDATTRDAGFRAGLDAMAMFWRYSPTNQWLIRRVCPHATRVAGKRTWARLGRAPRPGAVPIKILAPSRAGRGFPFLSVPVFDISQTEGRDLPSLSMTLEGDDAPVEALEAAAARLGIRIVEGRPTGPLGLTVVGRSRGGEIEIAAGLTRVDRVAVLAHELAHELLHQGDRARKRGPVRSVAEEETEAEATSYVVMRALGLASTAPTYIAWRGGSGAAVLRSLRRIQRAARAILDAAQSW